MRIIAHRGLWHLPEEQNTLTAIARAFDHGFGIETDIRDCQGRLVIAHNPPAGKEPELDQMLALVQGRPLPLALNIKADGLAEGIRTACQRQSIDHWFVFDMSVPDMRQHVAINNHVYGRMSEVEMAVPWAERISGIWLDAFDGLWYDASLLEKLLNAQPAVCVVSAELHNRDTAAQWALLKPYAQREHLILCTDLPLEAHRYFGLEAQ